MIGLNWIGWFGFECIGSDGLDSSGCVGCFGWYWSGFDGLTWTGCHWIGLETPDCTGLVALD